MKVTSATYHLSYLAKHPLTRDIVFRHLSPIIQDDHQLYSVHASLDEMFHHNMGGGIPYEIITKLMAELDEIPASVLATQNTK